MKVESNRGSLGALLSDLREQLGISVEEASRDTRIRADFLRDMEANQLYRFSHPSYARLFLRDYAKYLGMPAEQLRDLLPETGQCVSDGYSYLSSMEQDTAKPGASRSGQRNAGASAGSGATVLFAVAFCVLLGLGGFQIWSTYRSASSAPAARGATESPAPTADKDAAIEARSALTVSETVSETSSETGSIDRVEVVKDESVVSESLTEAPAKTVPAAGATPLDTAADHAMLLATPPNLPDVSNVR